MWFDHYSRFHTPSESIRNFTFLKKITHQFIVHHKNDKDFKHIHKRLSKNILSRAKKNLQQEDR